MKVALIALIIGLLSVCWLPILPSIYISITIVILGILLVWTRFYLLGLLLLGFAWSSYCINQTLADRLDPTLDGATVWIEGKIVGLPEQAENIVRFYLKEAQSENILLPKKIRLSWYNGQPVKTGERWRFLVRLKYPRGTVNPYSFDYEAWLTAKHIGATGSVRQAEQLSSGYGLTTWRYHLRQKMLEADTGNQIAGLIALVVGDGSGVTPAQWQILQDTGTVHLMVISGQHITLLAGFLYFLIAWLVRLGYWPRSLPWLPCACGLSMLGALGYGLLAGFDVPVQRACIMLALVLLWRLKFRRLGVLTPFLIALATVLVFDPLASLQPGFWLSFSAVAILLLGFSGRLAHGKGLLNIIKVEWMITIGLAPILLALLLPVSLTSPIANLIAVPVVTTIIVPLALLGTLLLIIPYLGYFLLYVAGHILSLLFWVLTVIANFVPAWIVPMAPWWAFLLSFIGVAIVLLPYGVPIRLFGVVLCLPLFLPVQQTVTLGHADITVFDVGQGLSVVIKTQSHTLLYDTGPRFGDFNLAERAVIPSLRRQNITSLDQLIISHADVDHAGGLEAIVRGLQVKEIVSGEPNKLSSKLSINGCQSGRQWEWDGVRFLLWQWDNAKNGNDASCVLLVEANNERLLLTGDISSRAEKVWIQFYEKNTINWLSASHHGSKTGSSWNFLKTMQPENVIVSRGWLNHFNHPHPTVVSRYQRINAEVFDTAESGALQIKLGQFLPVIKQRDVKYFWRKQ